MPQSSRLAALAQSEIFPGLLLVSAAAIAILAANLPIAASWDAIWQTEFSIDLGGHQLRKPILHWINDGLMVLFFFFIGLEIKHEVLDGELQSLRQATLPIAGAIGGMVVPALVYALIVGAGDDDAARAGWGIPMATDIAFALGVLALLGRRVPPGLKVFLASLAIVDDLGAVLVIAIFYTETIAWQFLVGGLLLVAGSWSLNKLGVRRTWPYVVIGLLLWLLFLKSGVHATIAGVLLATTVPARRKLDEKAFAELGRRLVTEFDDHADPTPRTNKRQLRALRELQQHSHDVQAPLQRMEHGLAPLVAHFIVPLFALANAGVDFIHGAAAATHNAAAQATFFGLLFGKPLGIMLMAWLAARLLGSDLPRQTNWRHLHGASWLAGIGFTMSLFINGLAFPDGSPAFRASKIAVLAASLLAAAVGIFLLLRAGSPASGTSPDKH